MKTALWIGLVASSAGGCIAGASLNENRAGGDSWLSGSGPVDDVLPGDSYCAWTGRPYVSTGVEQAYTMLQEADQDCAAGVLATRQTVWSLRPGQDAAVPIVDVTGLQDVRLLDSASGLLLMGEAPDGEHLYAIDEEARTVRLERPTSSRYWGTRTSPSRRWIVGVDNAAPAYPTHVIDPATLDSVSLDADCLACEAMWLHTRDTLAWVGFVADQPGRIRLWDFSGLEALPAPDAVGVPTLEVELSDASFAAFPSYSWITTDPEDRWLAVPVIQAETDLPVIEVVDLATGVARQSVAARGPVAFTPDGSTIVAWDVTEDGDAQHAALVLIDPVSLDSQRIELGYDGLPTYFVSRDGNEVLVADLLGEAQLVLLDLATGSQTRLDRSLALDAFSARDGHDEVWIVDEGLWRVDLLTGGVDAITLGWMPSNVVWMPQNDLLFLDDRLQPRMVFWNPTSRDVVTDVTLTRPPASMVAVVRP